MVQAIPSFAMSCLSFLLGFVVILVVWYENFGGVFHRRGRAFVGRLGSICVGRKFKEGWTLKTLNCLINLCLLSNYGGFFIDRTLCVLRFLNLIIIRVVIYGKLR